MSESEKPKKPKKKYPRSKTQAPTGNPAWRQPTPIDWKEVEQMAENQCNYDEVAGIYGLTVETLKDRCIRETGTPFSLLMQAAAMRGRKRIRQAQVDFGCEKGNASLLIHLGEHYLGQVRKTEVDVTSPIQLVVKTVTLTKPEQETPKEPVDAPRDAPTGN